MRVLAACDSEYYKEYFPSFYCSAKEAGYTPIVHIVNPTKEVLDNVSKVDTPYGYHFTTSTPSKNYYACSRFLVAEHYLENGPLLITDIDCLFIKPMPPIQEDVGLFIREHEWFPGMKVAAGIMWLQNNPLAKRFIQQVAENIKTRPDEWYNDQYAIYDVYTKMKDELSIKVFTNLEMDWEFRSNSYMWTGKGHRKHTVMKYIELSNEYKEKFNFSVLHPL